MAQKRKRQTQVAVTKGIKPLPRDPALRTVRPRPLHFQEKLRVLWPEDPELERIDRGAFAKWLREAEEARERGDLNAVGSFQAKVVIVGNTSNASSKAQKSASERAPPPSTLGAEDLLVDKREGKMITVPNFRRLAKREWPREPLAGGDAPKSREEAAYIRHRDQTPDEVDLKVEYDLDSDDEEWLANRNRKGIGSQLTDDDLERLMDGFEKAKHALLEKQQAVRNRRGGSSTATPPEDRAPSEIYPAAQAIEEFGGDYASLTVRAVHNYWAKKAAASKLPLLQRFWYDKPWARALAQSRREVPESDNESDDGVPFQGKDSAPRPSLRGRARTLDLEEVEDRLYIARQDLESLRTIADQVRRREKFKKRQLIEWRTEWRERVFLARQGKKKKVTKKPGKQATKKPGKTVSRKAAAAAAQKSPTAKRTMKATKPKGTKPVRGRGTKEQAGEGSGQKKMSSPVSGSRSIGGGIVSAVVDQLRRLGSWGQRSDENFQGTNGKAGLLPAGELDLNTKEIRKAVPAAPLTRKQEQAVLHAAIELSLQEQKKAAGKKVRFAENEMDSPKRDSPKRKGTAKKSQGTTQRVSRATAKTGTETGAAKVPAVGRERRASARPASARDAKQADAPKAFIRKEPGRNARVPVHWTASCKHGSNNLYNLQELVNFFQEHGKCRVPWGQFKQQEQETDAAYRRRLKAAVPFDAQKPTPLSSVKKQRAPARKSAGKAGIKVAATVQKRAAEPHGSAGNLCQKRATGGNSEGAGDSVAEAARRRTAGRLQADHDQPQAAQEASEERVGARRLKRSMGTKDLARSRQLESSGGDLEDAGAQALDGTRPGNAESPSECSSGSDTFVSPAPHEDDSESEEQAAQLPSSRRRGGVRLTRQSGASASREKLMLPKIPLEWRGRAAGEAASDESSFSEGSGPSFFSQPGRTASGTRRQARGAARKDVATGPKKKANLVAAARQRAKRAAGRR